MARAMGRQAAQHQRCSQLPTKLRFDTAEVQTKLGPHRDCCDAQSVSGLGHLRRIGGACAVSGYAQIATERRAATVKSP
jgi:hypothetical protein